MLEQIKTGETTNKGGHFLGKDGHTMVSLYINGTLQLRVQKGKKEDIEAYLRHYKYLQQHPTMFSGDDIDLSVEVMEWMLEQCK